MSRKNPRAVHNLYEPRLNKYTSDEILDLRARALEYLRQHHLDSAGCAKSLGLSLGEFFELRNAYSDDFRMAEEELYAKCEAFLASVSLGITEAKPNQVQTAKWMLERRKQDWTPLKRVQSEVKSEKVAENGRGEQLLKRFESGRKSEEEKPKTVRSGGSVH